MWKKIKGFPDYFINEKGIVKSRKILYNKRYKTLKIKKTELSHFNILGYPSVNLVSKGKRKSVRIHRLLALSFIPNFQNKPHINHKNGIKNDFSLNNLEWCTPSENEKHSHRILGKITNGIKRRKIPIKDIEKIKKRYLNGEKQKIIANDYNVHQSVISNIIKGKAYVKHI